MARNPGESAETETFREFADSFSYGARGDTFFKFLKGLSDDDAADLFRDVLRLIGDVADTGDPAPLVERVIVAQALSYSPAEPGEFRWSYEDSPFALLGKPVSRARVALLTSSGHFVKGNDPEPLGVKGMTQEEAERRIAEFPRAPILLSEIPSRTPDENLVVRHGGYDVRGARRDPGTTFPLARLREMECEGIIGELAPIAYSFVGNVSQHRMLREAGPEWVARVKSRDVDAMLMVPV